MKLCFIWVENYKGFVNQGFNFDTEFEYYYSSNTSKVSRQKNRHHIHNFFGEGITEITGIIGRNASGKTNILELIQYISDGANTIINTSFLAIFSDSGNTQIYFYKINELHSDFPAHLREYEGRIPETTSVFFSNIFDGRRHNFGKRIINISTNDLLNSQFGENVNKNYQKTIQQQIKFIKSPQFKFLEEAEIEVDNSPNLKLKPAKVILTSPIWANITNRVKTFELKLQREYEYQFPIKDFVQSFRKKITDNKSINSIRYFTAFLVYIDFILNRDILKYTDEKRYKNKNEYLKVLESLFKITEVDSRIDEIFKFITSEFMLAIDEHYSVFETVKFLKNLQEFELDSQSSDNFKQDIGTYSNRRIQYNLDYNDRIGIFLNGYLDAVTNQSLSYGVEWAGISSGHKAYINLFSNFYAAASKIRDRDVLICIDEGDLYFHPKWQTEFLFKLIKILPRLLKKNCQLFLTTHSPFLVSDLPKNNLIFVDKNEKGILEVISNKRIDGQTFGGNIGELYLDAFFMQGNLISHFAASKIQELVNKVRKDKRSINEDDFTLLEQLGDQLIQKQILNILHDKN
ncbi:AAA family ATPase [Flavobacterium sp.]|uniref:AAA family ATPase n=1 Tax=Flavobacterium sp. TaxID=239 RepID=UPI0025BBE948|nr:AAA family ATPase [Flavobacterium sp.]